jgi:hypothetical protein
VFDDARRAIVQAGSEFTDCFVVDLSTEAADFSDHERVVGGIIQVLDM